MNKSITRIAGLCVGVVLTGMLAAPAMAGVSVGVNIGVPGAYVAPQPVYVQPAPVYYPPPPVYVRPAPVYVSPAPVYYQRDYYRRHHHWHRPPPPPRHWHGRGGW